MIDLSVPDAPPQPTRRRRIPLLLLGLIAAIVVVAAGAITTTVLVRHYRNAPILECQCVLSWDRIDAPHVRTSHHGGETDYTAPARTPARQAFYIDIANRSSVTQTILGLSSDEQALLYRLKLGISTHDLDGTDLTEAEQRYRTGPVSIPPHGLAVLRLSVRITCQEARSSVLWPDMGLRVRVGAFTRTERVGLDRSAMGFRGTAASSACPSISN